MRWHCPAASRCSYQRQRIAAQKNPDGSAFEPRNLRGKMFRKLRTAKHLKVRAMADSITAGFFGRTAGVARVHHYGLRERGIRYPARELLGFSAADQELVRNLLLKHLTD